VSKSSSVEERFLPRPVTPAVEVEVDIPEDWDGIFPALPSSVRGALVKLTVTIPEAKLPVFDRERFREGALFMGAERVHAINLRVIRSAVKRDERHNAEVSLEESIQLFAGETKPQRAMEKVRLALSIAREADGEA